MPTRADKKRCPHCKAVIASLNYHANYSETSYGYVNGTVDFELENHESRDNECTDSDNYEEYDEEYFCPVCGEKIRNPEEDLLPLKMNKVKVKKYTTNTLGDFPKTKHPRLAQEVPSHA